MEMKCHYSFLSRGTERRRSRGQQYPDKSFGYINIARLKDNFWIRPLPHGAGGTNQDALYCRSQSLATVVLARMQLIAASAFHSRDDEATQPRSALVIGSGPVALGAALELQRLGCTNVVIHTSGRAPKSPLTTIKGIHIEQELAPECVFSLVIDAVGSSQSIDLAINHCELNAKLGLLGSPEGILAVDLYKIHRNNINLLGLHELNCGQAQRQRLIQDVHHWLSNHHVSLANSVCELHSSDAFELSYPALLEYSSPFLIHGFDWGGR